MVLSADVRGQCRRRLVAPPVFRCRPSDRFNSNPGILAQPDLFGYASARLINRVRDPDVRTQASFALGRIGCPRAIPHLIYALDHDREVDSQGHSPRSVSALSLDDILGTSQTRIVHESGIRSMAPWPPDYDALKTQAAEFYEKWLAQTPPPATPPS